MKKSFVLAILLGIVALCHAQPKINGLAYPSNVNLFGLYEISFQMGTYANPYDPAVIDVYAVFTAPDGRTMKVNGFYYEGYRFEEYKGYEKSQAEARSNGWRVRFTPDQQGSWRFTLHATDKRGSVSLDSYGGTSFSFSCKGVQNASGFIATANTRYLKRDVVANGRRQSQSFFPVGPNVAWYSCKSYYNFATPYGIYEYEQRIDSLAGRANYMRIWLNRQQYLSLYGSEYTQTADGKAPMYFDNTLNQKDAAELDRIIEYAAQKGIAVMPCIFTYGDFKADPKHDGQLDKNPADWRCNPYNTVLGLKTPADFFTNKEAQRIARNLVRYVVARWGYATNIVAWELWNEISNMDLDKNAFEQYSNNVTRWHNDMAQYIRSNDPFDHPITTSIGYDDKDYLFNLIFSNMDIVLEHHYFNVQKAKSKEQISHQLYRISLDAHKAHPDKPFFIGEYGFGSSSSQKYLEKDPHGVDLHNTLWSTLFSGTMGSASFWQWTALEKCGIHGIFKPVTTFSKSLPIPSATFEPRTTGEENTTAKYSVIFPNGIETYYMINAAEDTLYGWCQDTAFTYQALRRLTDKVGSNGHFKDDGLFDAKGYVYTLNASKRPRPSSRSNTITLPVVRQPEGTAYTIRWYDTETGLELVGERTTATVKGKALTFDFPSSIRNLRKRNINNTFGDAAFVITRDNKNGSTPESNAANKSKTIRTKKRTID
jgi:hypothetical protein